MTCVARVIWAFPYFTSYIHVPIFLLFLAPFVVLLLVFVLWPTRRRPRDFDRDHQRPSKVVLVGLGWLSLRSLLYLCMLITSRRAPHYVSLNEHYSCQLYLPFGLTVTRRSLQGTSLFEQFEVLHQCSISLSLSLSL